MPFSRLFVYSPQPSLSNVVTGAFDDAEIVHVEGTHGNDVG